VTSFGLQGRLYSQFGPIDLVQKFVVSYGLNTMLDLISAPKAQGQELRLQGLQRIGFVGFGRLADGLRAHGLSGYIPFWPPADFWVVEVL
jgi:hypothetical protein